MPRGGVIVAGIAVAAGVVWFVIKNRQASANASADTAAAAGTGSPGVDDTCYDGAGNVVDCTDANAVSGPGAASALQTEIGDLQGDVTSDQSQITATKATETKQAKELSEIAAEEKKEDRKPKPRRPVPRQPKPKGKTAAAATPEQGTAVRATAEPRRPVSVHQSRPLVRK